MGAAGTTHINKDLDNFEAFHYALYCNSSLFIIYDYFA